MTMDTEKTDVTPEVDEIAEGESSDESVETSATEKDTSELAEQEKAEPETPPAEDYETKVKRLAQSMKDKEMKSVYQEIENLKKQNKELSTQATEKTWDRGIQSLFDEESESMGEDEAAKRKSAREIVKKQVLEYQQNKAYVDKTKPELEAKYNALSNVERDQQAMRDLWPLLFPEDIKKVEQVNALIKKFEKARDPDEYELILEGIKESLKSKTAKFKPDSGLQGGGGSDLKTISFNKNAPSASEMISAGLRKK
jgi:hypothetical protein